ncbi:MAG: aminodeoxychorismate/anthranilate synthase component II [Planctomycetota bacterium]|nr:aminodeoxychorismate/anthranilate synthase component II [Planctomycetota bacterium]
MILVIDNYDSFTWNLVHRIGELDEHIEVRVVRNDAITIQEIRDLAPTHIILSPGPCTPEQSGICRSAVASLRGEIPILGVCLGHQAIADSAGMVVRRSGSPVHGKTSPIHHDGRGLFAGLSNPFEATRYHSLIVDESTLHKDYEISARVPTGEIMGLRWKAPEGSAPLEGVQFHPESFLTLAGPQLLANFLSMRLPALRVRA